LQYAQQWRLHGLGRVFVNHMCPFSPCALDELLGGEFVDGSFDRDARDIKYFRKLNLAGQSLGVMECAIEDEVFDKSVKLVIKRQWALRRHVVPLAFIE